MSEESKTITNRDISLILQIIASVIENVDVVGDYLGTDERYVVDMESTLKRLAQHLDSKATELEVFP